MIHLSEQLITIGITAFNEGKYLLEAWNSAIRQNDKRWEVVMVLDGGADKKTRYIFETLQHPHLKKITLEENKGPYHCRTLAIENASSPWYFHLDADDCLAEDSIKNVLKNIDEFPDMDYFWGKCLFFNNNELFINYNKKIDLEKMAISLQLFGQSPIKIKMFEALNGFHRQLYRGGADWEFWIRVISKGYQGKFINEILYERRCREKSVGDSWLLHRDKMAEIIIENNQEFFNKNNRKEQCKGKAYEMISRKYRSLGRRKLAAEYAMKAQGIGWNFSLIDKIIKENNMTSILYALKRLSRLLHIA